MRNALIAVGFALLALSAVQAEERKNTLTVHGVGSASVPADRLHIDFFLTASAETATDAEARLAKRVRTCVDGLELPPGTTAPVTTFAVFLHIGSTRVGEVAASDCCGKIIGYPETSFTRDFSIRFVNLRRTTREKLSREVARVLGSLVDALGTPNSEGFSKLFHHFELDDQDSVIGKANAAALASAKAQATGLAAAADRKLGKVVDLKSDIRTSLAEEHVVATNRPPLSIIRTFSETSSLSFDVQVESRVTVEFQLEDR